MKKTSKHKYVPKFTEHRVRKTQEKKKSRTIGTYIPLVVMSLAIVGGASTLIYKYRKNKENIPLLLIENTANTANTIVTGVNTSTNDAVVSVDDNIKIDNKIKIENKIEDKTNYGYIDVFINMIKSNSVLLSGLQRKNIPLLGDILNTNNDFLDTDLSKRRALFNNIYNYIPHNRDNRNLYISNEALAAFSSFLKVSGVSDLFTFKFAGDSCYCGRNKACNLHRCKMIKANMTNTLSFSSGMSNIDNSIVDKLYMHAFYRKVPITNPNPDPNNIINYTAPVTPQLMLISNDNINTRMEDKSTIFIVKINGVSTKYVLQSYAIYGEYDSNDSKPDDPKYISCWNTAYLDGDSWITTNNDYNNNKIDDKGNNITHNLKYPFGLYAKDNTS